jgi:hypothetical protein
VRAALRRTIPLSAAVAWLTATTVAAGPFPATLELSELDGTNGFVLTGIAAGDAAGYAVSGAGDVNGDGTDDIVIGAYGADPGGRSAAGQTYVIFGAPDIGATGALALASLDGSNGYALNGINRVENNDLSGLSAGGAGDVNGDGVGDVIVGAFLAGPPGREDAGQAYIVFGGANVGLAGRIELAQLDGRNGFTLNGWYERGETGCCVASGGDVNGDGYGDFIIGAVWADPGLRLDAGQTYVVFGGLDIGAEEVVELKLLDGNDGLRSMASIFRIIPRAPWGARVTSTETGSTTSSSVRSVPMPATTLRASPTSCSVVRARSHRASSSRRSTAATAS